MYQSFIFEDFVFDKKNKKAILKYSFDGKIVFEESFIFDFDFVNGINQQILDRALFGLWIMCGISYFKAFLPPKIIIKKHGLIRDQARFFEKIYKFGLGEFFYKNEISPEGKINFPVIEEIETQQEIGTDLELKGSIVLIGGGKDSITTAEILKDQNEDFETLTVGEFPFFDGMLRKIGKKHLTIRRKLDSKLFELNEQGALNGHVPISSILAFASIVTAILRGKKNVILSNESSAKEPNVVLQSGMKINHQYSKSLEFEKDFQNYMKDFVSSSVKYFSFLRPLSELKIAEIFCKNFFNKYVETFSSCNRNFHIKSSNSEKVKTPIWCGECPKCAFVFLLFTSFLANTELEKLFGKNMLNDKKLTSIFRELLGISGIKPFECVGEINEVRMAVQMAKKTSNFPGLDQFEFPETNFDYNYFAENSMPEKFEEYLKKYLKK